MPTIELVLYDTLGSFTQAAASQLVTSQVDMISQYAFPATQLKQYKIAVALEGLYT